MNTISRRTTVIFAIGLSLMLWLTRGQHVASLGHLPDASWAIFFLIGFYFRQRMMLPLFLAQAALIDYLAIAQFGVDNFCATPAYAFLLPAYSSLWLAGHWYAKHFQFQVRTLPLLAVVATGSAFVCELISSGSFYFLGGRFADTSLQEFATRLVQYFPTSLSGVALYLGIAALIHVLVYSAQRSSATVQ